MILLLGHVLLGSWTPLNWAYFVEGSLNMFLYGLMLKATFWSNTFVFLNMAEEETVRFRVFFFRGY